MFSPYKIWLTGVLIVCLSLAGATGCSAPSGSADNPGERDETLTQISTLSALMAGTYDGVITCGELKSYGSFGIGTFAALDGEMVVLDGRIYQVKADGVAYAAGDSLGVPFAAVTHFNNDREESLAPGLSLEAIQETLDTLIPSSNLFYAIRINGTFSYVKTRSVPAQVKPYPPLTEVTQYQPVFEFHDVTGTVVGFRCPEYVNGMNVPGYHLHFLTSDLKAGGHLLELTTNNARVMLDYTPGFYMLLPDLSSDFHKLDLTGDLQSDIEKVEK